MGLSGTDFLPANPTITTPTTITPLSHSHLLILDFHLPSAATQATHATRRTLRDLCTRFLYKLFHYPPPSASRSNLHILLVNPLPTPTDTPTLALLTDTPSLRDSRSHGPALARLRTAARSPSSLLDTHINHYTTALVTDAKIYATGRTLTFITPTTTLSSALQQTLQTASLPAQVTNASDIPALITLLDTMLAHMHETQVALSLPSSVGGASNNGVLQLIWRPRVLTRDPANAPDALSATKLLRISSIPEDVLAGPPRVLWAERQGDTLLFASVCDTLRREQTALACVARTELGGCFVVLLPPKQGAALLVREVAHADSLLPVPPNVDHFDEVAGERMSKEETAGGGMELLPIVGYEPSVMKLGGTWTLSRARGKGEMRADWTNEEMSDGIGSGDSGRGVDGDAVIRKVNFSFPI